MGTCKLFNKTIKTAHHQTLHLLGEERKWLIPSGLDDHPKLAFTLLMICQKHVGDTPLVWIIGQSTNKGLAACFQKQATIVTAFISKELPWNFSEHLLVTVA